MNILSRPTTNSKHMEYLSYFLIHHLSLRTNIKSQTYQLLDLTANVNHVLFFFVGFLDMYKWLLMASIAWSVSIISSTYLIYWRMPSRQWDPPYSFVTRLHVPLQTDDDKEKGGQIYIQSRKRVDHFISRIFLYIYIYVVLWFFYKI